MYQSLHHRRLKVPLELRLREYLCLTTPGLVAEPRWISRPTERFSELPLPCCPLSRPLSGHAATREKVIAENRSQVMVFLRCSEGAIFQLALTKWLVKLAPASSFREV